MLTRGKPLHSGRVVVFCAPDEGPPRAACIAGRKVGNAVRRNRARRVLREAWRTVSPRVIGNHAFVLVARRAIEGAGTQDLVTEIEGTLARAGLMES